MNLSCSSACFAIFSACFDSISFVTALYHRNQNTQQSENTHTHTYGNGGRRHLGSIGEALLRLRGGFSSIVEARLRLRHSSLSLSLSRSLARFGGICPRFLALWNRSREGGTGIGVVRKVVTHSRVFLPVVFPLSTARYVGSCL